MLFSIADLAEPHVVLIGMYPSMVFWARFEDAGGRRAEVCLDRRDASATKNRLFDRARHPKYESAVLIELGSVEEGVAVSLMSNYLDSAVAIADGCSDEGLEIFRDALLRVGDPVNDDSI